jgi:hypothetical protein
MRTSTIKYNPKLSIEENAEKNGCSAANIRYYIKVNNIDRCFDRKVSYVTKCRALYQAGDTPYLLQKKVGGSINTIKKYWSYILGSDVSDFDREKRQTLTLREAHDYYATHPSVTRDLLDVETFHSEILEPCCGGGYMAEVIKNEGYSVVASDLVDRGYGQGGVDFLTTDFPHGKYDVITNPPYFRVVDFIAKAIRICKHKCALLLPLNYLSGAERWEIFRDNPPKTVYVYRNRIYMAKNGDFVRYKHTKSMEIYAWYVWEKGFRGNPCVKWLKNDKNA